MYPVPVRFHRFIAGSEPGTTVAARRQGDYVAAPQAASVGQAPPGILVICDRRYFWTPNFWN
jgi:hypothetical protein